MNWPLPIPQILKVVGMVFWWFFYPPGWSSQRIPCGSRPGCLLIQDLAPLSQELGCLSIFRLLLRRNCHGLSHSMVAMVAMMVAHESAEEFCNHSPLTINPFADLTDSFQKKNMFCLREPPTRIEHEPNGSKIGVDLLFCCSFLLVQDYPMVILSRTLSFCQTEMAGVWWSQLIPWFMAKLLLLLGKKPFFSLGWLSP